MKKNRMMLKRNKRRGNILLVLIFGMILPVMAIYIGLHITKMWVSPVLNSEEGNSIIALENNEVKDNGEDNNKSETTEENKNNNKINYIKAEIEPFSVYTIQIASLADNKNVDDFIGALNDQKLAHLIYKTDNSYKVYVSGGTKRTHVETELVKVKTLYPDAYISEVHPLVKNVEYPQDERAEKLETIITDLNEVIKTMDKQGEAWYNYFVSEGSLDNYVELLKIQQNLLVKLSEKISGVELPEGFFKKGIVEKMIAYQEGNIKRSLELYEENEVDNAHRLHSLFLDNLFRIVEIIK